MPVSRVGGVGPYDTSTVTALGFVDEAFLDTTAYIFLSGISATTNLGTVTATTDSPLLPSLSATTSIGNAVGIGGATVVSLTTSIVATTAIGIAELVTPMTNIKIGSTTPTELHVGGTQIFKAYAGPNLVWFQSQGQPVGFSSSLLSITGQNSSWNQQTIDISSYVGNTVYFVIKYVSGTSYRGDFQIDDITIDGTTYNFDSNATGWSTSNANSSGQTFTYSNISWQNVGTNVGAYGEWVRDSGGTGSSGTGLSVDHTLGTSSGFYLYTETSSHGYGGTEFWLRSPSIVLSSSPGNLTFWEARYGSNIGTSNYYLDVTA